MREVGERVMFSRFRLTHEVNCCWGNLKKFRLKIEVVDLRRGNNEQHAPIASARPSAQAASTLPPTYSTEVPASPTSPARSSISLKKRPAITSKLVTMRLPARASTLRIGPASGTCTCNAHLPKPSRSVSVTRDSISASRITSWPVMPRSTLPLPTKEGMSPAGRKTLW